MKDRVENHIKLLLHLHDCVIVPGFGAFVGSYRPARADHQRGLIYPPGKDILFNPSLTRDDGLLTDLLARSCNSSYSQSAGSVREFVADIKSQLKTSGRYIFDELGEFSLISGGKIRFEPYLEENYLADSFGLIPASLSGKSYKPADRKSVAKKLRPLMVFFPVVAALGAASWLGYSNQDFRAELASFLPTASAPVEYRERYAFEPPQDEAVVAFMESITSGQSFLDLSEEGETFIVPVHSPATKAPSAEPVINETPVTAVVPAPEEKTIPAPVAPKKVNDISGNFHIITGCFSQQENAEKHILQLKEQGIEAFIAGEVKGLFRVSAGSFSSKVSASEKLADLKSNGNPAAWIWNAKNN